MSDIFLDLLNRSITAGWVVLAVILTRFLLRRAPKRYTCALWAIVGARLLNIHLPEAPISLIPSRQTITPESMYDMEPVITSGVEIIDNIVNPIYTSSFHSEPYYSVNPLQVWTAVFANIWLLVMIGIWLWAIFSWFRLSRRVRESVCLRDNIYLCDAIDTPFILGILKPKIYLPSTLTEEQQRHVIAHEEAHIRRGDFYYKPIAYFLLSVHWFNPLIWVAYILLCRDIELACDERVIADMSGAEKKGYSTALLDCSVHRHMIAACPLAFGEVGVKERVKAVLNYKKPAFWVTIIAIIVSIVLAVCFVTDPVTPTTPEVVVNSLSAENVEWAQVTLWNETSEHISLTEEEIQTLTDILNGLEKQDFVRSKVTEYDLSLMIHCGEKEILLKSDGDCTEFVFDSVTGKDIDEAYQYTLSEELNAFLSRFYGVSLSVPRMVNIDGIIYVDTGEALPAEIDPSAILGTLHTQVEGRPANHGQGNFACEGCQYARVEGAIAVLIDNEWVRFAEPVLTSPEYYLIIGAEGAVSIEIRTGSRTQMICKEDLGAYGVGETVLLPVLTGKENLRGVTITARDADNHDIFSVTITAKDHGTADGVIERGNWIITPSPLGIHLSVENPTASGLTLITTQDGTPWNSIFTGSYFSIAKWNGYAWDFLPQREGTAWTTVAYSVALNDTSETHINWEWVYGTLEPGTYRIYKSYSGERGFLADREKVNQTCFAEFTIE